MRRSRSKSAHKCIPYNNRCVQNFIQIGWDLAVWGPETCFGLKQNGQAYAWPSVIILVIIKHLLSRCVAYLLHHLQPVRHTHTHTHGRWLRLTQEDYKLLECGCGEEWKRSAGLIKLLMRKFVEEQMKIIKYWTLFGKWNIDGLVMFWNLTAFNMKLMKAKPTRRQRRIQMLHDLTNNGGSVALKWAAEDREGWRYRERMSKAGDYWTDERESTPRTQKALHVDLCREIKVTASYSIGQSIKLASVQYLLKVQPWLIG